MRVGVMKKLLKQESQKHDTFPSTRDKHPIISDNQETINK